MGTLLGLQDLPNTFSHTLKVGETLSTRKPRIQANKTLEIKKPGSPQSIPMQMEREELLITWETNGEGDLTSKTPNKKTRIQKRGCHAWIFTRMRKKRKKMIRNSFIGLDLMDGISRSKMKQGR